MKYIFLISVLFIQCLAISAPLTGSNKATKGGIFNVNLSSEPSSLSPFINEVSNTKIKEYVLEPLAEINYESYEWDPYLAESFEVSKDNKIFTFKIRKGVKAHTGENITAANFKHAYDAIMDDKFKSPVLKGFYKDLKKVEVVDDYTLKVTVGKTYFKNFDVAASLVAMPLKTYKTPNKKYNKFIDGTGPYKFSKWQKGKRIVLVKNPEWWGNKVDTYKNRNNFDSIVFRYVKEPTVQLRMLEKEKLDYITMDAETYVKKAKGPAWGKKVSKVKAVNDKPKGYGFVAWNLQDDKLKDKNVRRALAHTLNRKFINDKFLHSMYEPMAGPWPSITMYADKSVKPIPFDLEKAKELFKKAEWSDSDKDGILDKKINGKLVKMSLTIVTAAKQTIKQLQVYQLDAKKVGVDVQLKQVEWSTLVKLIDEKKFDGIALAWGNGPVHNDPNQIWHSGSSGQSGSNFISYNNPKVDALIDKARGIVSNEKRVPVMQEIYRIIADDAPYMFLFTPKFELYGKTNKMSSEKDTYKYSVGTEFWWMKAK